MAEYGKNDMPMVKKAKNANLGRLATQKKAIDHNPAGRTCPMAGGLKGGEWNKKGY